jgi:hypothetical protein
LQAGGALDMAVTVGQVLLLTTYKPAICGGTPATMQFRFTQKLNGG